MDRRNFLGSLVALGVWSVLPKQKFKGPKVKVIPREVFDADWVRWEPPEGGTYYMIGTRWEKGDLIKRLVWSEPQDRLRWE